LAATEACLQGKKQNRLQERFSGLEEPRFLVSSEDVPPVVLLVGERLRENRVLVVALPFDRHVEQVSQDGQLPVYRPLCLAVRQSCRLVGFNIAGGDL